MTPPQALRRHLLDALEWDDAHLPLRTAFAEVPTELRGRVPDGLPYSLWQLLEHVRRTQHDLVAFCRNPNYHHPSWPADFWPAAPEPPEPEAWERSLTAYHEDLDALKTIVRGEVDLFRPTPSGTGRQTFLRAILLAIDHTAYHLGQAVVLRRMMGIWPLSR